MECTLKPIKYKNAEIKAEETRQLFTETLEFNDVKICKNFSKAEIIKELEDVKVEVEDFASANYNKRVFAFAVVWIGFKLDQNNS